MVPLSGRQFIFGNDCPSVFFVDKDLPCSHVDHWFDREYHTGNQKHPCPFPPEMADLRLLMKFQSDTMTTRVDADVADATKKYRYSWDADNADERRQTQIY